MDLFDVKPLTIDWGRSIQIDATVDDVLVKRLAPTILRLRQESADPITVGIDSLGGSLASLDVLLALLTGPTQTQKVGKIITVATHRAYSSAANLLAFGTYAVAMKHSEVLFHDVRYGGMEDVTPEKARDAAKSLQDANDAFALRLAHRIIPRLVWAYIDLQSGFAKAKGDLLDLHKRYSGIVTAYAPPIDGFQCFDLASFATCLWQGLSRANDSLIMNVMERLAQWIHLTNISQSVPSYRPKGSRAPGLLDGARHLHKLFEGRPEHFDQCEPGLKLFLSLLLAEVSMSKAEKVSIDLTLEKALREYGILQSLNDSKHVRYASDLMARHSTVFFGNTTDVPLDKLPEPERQALYQKAAPHARLLWHFCVLLCRELFEGEHILTPRDAQLLGLVDEVTGGGAIQSNREWREETVRREKGAENSTDPHDPDSI